MRGHLPIALALVALTFPALGQAEDEADSAAQGQADQLFQAGLAAVGAGDFSEAATLFEQSYGLFQHPGTLLNVGLYQLESGRRVAAHASFTELLDRFGDVISAETRDLTRSHLADLESSLASIEITSDPTGATLILDGDELGTTPLPGSLLLEPGEHQLEASLDLHQPLSQALTLSPGPNPPFELTLELVQTDSSEEETDPEETPERHSFWHGPWPWVIGSVLLVGAGVGLTVGLWPESTPAATSTLEFR